MRTRPARIRLAGLALALLAARPATAQIPVDALTEVRSIGFEGAHELPKRRLESMVATHGRGSGYAMRVLLGKLPFVPPPKPQPFSPLTLQEDVVRLRRLYVSEGFLHADVSYAVQRDETKNLLDITFVIVEGKPAVVRGVTVAALDSLAPLPVPEGERKSWNRLERSVLALRGHRLVTQDARASRDAMTRWWRDRGHPRALATVRLALDSTGTDADLAYRVHAGPFARFGTIEVEGTKTLSDHTVRRQLTFDPGDPYSLADLDRSARTLQELDIMRLARVRVPVLASADSNSLDSLATATGGAPELPVEVQITEADPRLLNGDIGYVTDAGISSQARWVHRNLRGSGRALTLAAIAQTGWLALTDRPEILYRFAISLKQPTFLKRQHTSAVVSPFIEHRDDQQDLSTRVGFNTTLVYRLRQFNSVSLDYELARKHIDQYRFGDLKNGDIDLLTFLTQQAQGLLDTLGSNLTSSIFTLSGNFGTLDNPTYPHRGVVVHPAALVTAPSGISSTTYWRLDLTGSGFYPLGSEVVFASRFRVGRLFPFGKSLPGPNDDPQTKFLQLRDAAFTAGGTGDVRGWDLGLLGPKLPDVRFTTVGDSLVPHANGYVGVGGFARATFSLGLLLPAPWLGPNFGSTVFLDGGRVWTDDARFGLGGADPNGQENMFYATGAGFSVRTPVGPIEASAGYKLNPSVIDLVDAADLLRAAAAGTPINDLPRHDSRRWQFHLAFGASY
jgi:outer membrane protein assembly factor BamA